MPKTLNKEEWALVAISYAEEGFLSPAQLQKSLFLLKENKPSAVGKEFYKFKPYNYGPFCKDIYSDTKQLESEGLIKFTRPIGKGWAGYSLTEEGKKRVGELITEAKEEDLKYLSEIVNWVRSISFKQLLTAIYQEYPKYKINSIFSGV